MSDRPEYPTYPGGDGPHPGAEQPPGQPAWGQQPPGQPAWGQQPYGQASQGQQPYGQPPRPPGWGQAPYQAPYAQPYGYTYPPRPIVQTSGKAIAALVLGISSIVLCYVGFLVGPAAIVLGALARREIEDRAGFLGGGSLATAGLVTGIVGTVVWGLVIALMIIGLSVS
jgi:hypothetical protein